MTAWPHLAPADIDWRYRLSLGTIMSRLMIDWRYRLSLGTIMSRLMIADAHMFSPMAKTIDGDRVIEFRVRGLPQGRRRLEQDHAHLFDALRTDRSDTRPPAALGRPGEASAVATSGGGDAAGPIGAHAVFQ